MSELERQDPQPGEMVFFHHGEDAAWWPALVLEVTQTTPVAPHTPPTVMIEGQRVEVAVPPPAEETVAHLQVFRPRGNMWFRSTEGDGVGQWRRNHG